MDLLVDYFLFLQNLVYLIQLLNLLLHLILLVFHYQYLHLLM
jgi:hypothetical protein